MKILLVEDDLALSDVVSFTLRRAGYVVVAAYDGLAALEQFAAAAPDLLLLDLNLPRLDGLGVCRQVRAESDVPIIILSVRGEDEAVVRGLEMGADDYMVKPFSPAQLVARIRAVMRRSGVAAAPSSLVAGGLTLDRSRGEVARAPDQAGQPPVRLTALELKLLEALMIDPGRVLPSDTLIAAVWGPEGGDRAMLKQLVYRLRAKIEDETTGGYIETVPGIGYALARNDE
ncbi:MAG TPA: response regulator transcription factor [Promineifilum sp.]|nr:response regulator transcription factor [Promineifilum sp.]HRQ14805.1 response regulator transcription factor [Promineifilum sp.]